MNNQKILIGVVTVGLIVFAIALFSSPPDKTPTVATSIDSSFMFDETEFDFEVVKQSGGLVEHNFPFTYTGTEPITITAVPTSCGCTSAVVDNKTLKEGSKGTITVTFDPNLHAEPEGRFFKTISLITDPVIENAPELKIWAEIDLDLGPEFFKEAIHEGEVLLQTENLAPEKDYRTISATTLKESLEDKHFYLVDVHIPEQAHINGTDAVIAYDQITEHLDELPSDKDETIVLYCRSGSMSQQAAQTLTDQGYTNVIHVEGGINAYNGLDQ